MAETVASAELVAPLVEPEPRRQPGRVASDARRGEPAPPWRAGPLGMTNSNVSRALQL
jgi:hypothetical protein